MAFRVRSAAADAAPGALFSFILVAPLLFTAGTPGFVHDWIWPLFRTEKLWTWQELLSAWNANGIGHPNSVMTLNPLHWLQIALPAVLPIKAALDVYVLGCFFFITWGIDVFQREHLGLSRWAALAGACFAVSSAGIFGKFSAGQIGYLAASAAFAWGLVFLLRAHSRRSLKWTFAAACTFALCAIQLQILLLGLIAMVIAALVHTQCKGWLWRSFIGLAFSFCLALPSLASLAHFGPTKGADVSIPYRSWEMAQSSSNLDAASLMGYAGHYPERSLAIWPPLLAYERITTTAFCVAFAPILIFWRARRRRAAEFVALLGILGFLWVTGLKGFAGPLWLWLFQHVSYADFLREFFHAIILLTLAMGVSFGIFIEAVSSLNARAAVMAAIVGVGCTGLAFFSWGFARVLPFVSQPAYSSNIAARVGALPDGPILFLPVQQSLFVSGDPVGGNDLYDWTDSRHLTLYSYHLPPIVALASSQFEQDTTAALPLLARIGAQAVAVRGDVETRAWNPRAPEIFAQSREYSAFDVGRGDLAGTGVHRAIFIRPRRAQMVASMARQAAALTADLHALADPDPTRVYIDAPGVGAADIYRPMLGSPDPRAGWVRERDAPAAVPDGLWTPADALVTTGAHNKIRLPVAAGTRVTIWAPQGIKIGNRTFRAARFITVRTHEANVQIDSLGPAAIGEIDRRNVPLPGLGRCAGSAQRVAPWRYAGRVSIHGTCLFVLRVTYSPEWRLEAPRMEVMAHVRTDGFGNGWLLRGDGTTRIQIRDLRETQTIILLIISGLFFCLTTGLAIGLHDECAHERS